MSKYIICGNGKKYKLVTQDRIKQGILKKQDEDLQLLNQQVQETQEEQKTEQLDKKKNKDKNGGDN